MAAIISRARARQVLDSRGNPTVEAEVFCAGDCSSAIVPSGASTGKREALELRDGGKAFGGKGVGKAVSNVNKIIAPKLVGIGIAKQQEIDRLMIALDSTENKSRLGANAMLAVSMASARLAAKLKEKELFEYLGGLAGNSRFTLPVPQMNVINGGAHAGQDNDIQEHMIAPVGCKSYSEALQACVETYHALKGMLKKKFGAQATLLGDEGGFVPQIPDCASRLALIEEAVEEAGYKNEMRFALDSAASEFFNKGAYTIGKKKYSSAELVDFYAELASSFKICSFEDAMAQDDWAGWQLITKKLPKLQIVADDLTVTNPKIIREAISKKAANALLLKLNQIGTVSEAIEAWKLATSSGWNVVVSHRSGETEDSFIADLVVGLGAGQSKFGAPARSERTCKYNRLLRIEEALAENGKAKYAGRAVLRC